MARTTLAAREWARLTAMFGFITVINAAGWGIFVLCVMPTTSTTAAKAAVAGSASGPLADPAQPPGQDRR
jgi:hypothetical protein